MRYVLLFPLVALAAFVVLAVLTVRFGGIDEFDEFDGMDFPGSSSIHSPGPTKHQKKRPDAPSNARRRCRPTFCHTAHNDPRPDVLGPSDKIQFVAEDDS